MKKFYFLFILLGILVGYFIGVSLTPRTVIYKNLSTSPIIKYLPCEEPIIPENVSLASIKIPAVDQEGNGVVTSLEVQAFPGTGKTLVNIDRLLFWTDTQNSIRIAKMVAENVTGLNLSKYDLVYTIHANATVIEGPSAGAALTIATIAALENKKINSSVIMTGIINHDGTIGPVGNVLQKANASRDVGAKLFLVPLGQSKEVEYESKKYCQKIGSFQICHTEMIPKKVDIEKEVGIKVKEVENIQEALSYFLI